MNSRPLSVGLVAFTVFVFGGSAVGSEQRGLPAATPTELVKLIDSNLNKWLAGGDAVKPVLANEKELEALARRALTELSSFSVTPGKFPESAVRKEVADYVMGQNRSADQKSFVAVRAIVGGERETGTIAVDLFDAKGVRCTLDFLRLEGGRVAMVAAPLTGGFGTFEDIVGHYDGGLKFTFLEKKLGTWTQGEIVKAPKTAAVPAK